MQNTVEIRLELLKKIGEGFNKRETVKHIVETFGVTEQTAYYHFRTKEKWINQYCGFDADFSFQVKQRFNHIYREASFRYLHAEGDNARIGFLRTMIEANSKCAEYLPKDENADTNNTSKWGTSDELNASLRNNETWRQWINANCSREDHKTVTGMTRLWIRYEYDTNPKLNNEESLH